MIQFVRGNIFESQAQTIVNPVNTVGVMGAGLALQFKNKYPSMFEQYKKVCDTGLFTIGKLMLIHEQDHNILLFPTKDHWKNKSKLEYIEAGLVKFVNTYQQKNITSIAFPPLGCGRGGLSWLDVKRLMIQYLDNLQIVCFIYDLQQKYYSFSSCDGWMNEYLNG